MGDFLAFYDSAKWLLSGEYRSLYPLPLVYLFLPFTVFPPIVGYLILSIVSIALLVEALRWKSLLWVFYIPILQVLYLGQIDIIVWWLLKKATPLTLALATLKPHLFVLLGLPELIERRKDKKYILQFIFWCLAIYVPFFFIRPMWLFEWLGQIDDGRVYANNSASVWAAPVLFTLFLPFLWKIDLWERLKAKYRLVLLILNPGMRPYDYTLLTGYSYFLIVASWTTQVLANQIQADWPHVLLGFLALYLMNRNGRKKTIPDSTAEY